MYLSTSSSSQRLPILSRLLCYRDHYPWNPLIIHGIMESIFIELNHVTYYGKASLRSIRSTVSSADCHTFKLGWIHYWNPAVWLERRPLFLTTTPLLRGYIGFLSFYVSAPRPVAFGLRSTQTTRRELYEVSLHASFEVFCTISHRTRYEVHSGLLTLEARLLHQMRKTCYESVYCVHTHTVHIWPEQVGNTRNTKSVRPQSATERYTQKRSKQIRN